MNKKIIFLFALLGLLIYLGITYSNGPQQKGQQMLEFKEGDTYQEDWQQVEKFAQQRLPRSALEVVDKIYQKAKKADNAPQMIKALLHQMRFQQAYEEEALIKNIQQIEKEIEESRYPVTPPLQSMLAQMYWGYYQHNRYKILDRTETVGTVSDDIRTWDARQFVEKVISLYQASLANADSLKRTPLEVYAPILEKEKESRQFRPTLYDFLAHRAVDFFMNEETYLTKPSYQFQLRSEKPFLPAAQFANTKFDTQDTLSLKYQALSILQDLLRFHLEDADPAPLVDVDLKRLQFARQNSVHVQKDSLYLDALQSLEKSYLEHFISTEVSYQIASFYYEQGQQYQPGKSSLHKWDRKKAYEVCEKAIERFPESRGAHNCRALKSRITQKTLSISVEKVNPPDRPFRALVNFQNVRTIHLRAIPVTPEAQKEIRDNRGRRFNREQWIAYYRGLRFDEEWQVELPDDGDYHQHSVEIKMPALGLGQYIILVSTNPDFSLDKEAAAFGETWISNLGFVQKNSPDRQTEFYVFDRQEGQPLEGVEARLWIWKYDSKLRKMVERKGKIYTTDKAGHFEVSGLSKKQRRQQFKIDFHHGEDRLFLDDRFSAYPGYPRAQDGRRYERTFFFTDRSIYRPGQTLYFKGIIIETGDDQNEIKPNEKTTVTLFDVNRQKVEELDLTTNEYGTFSGSFTLPSTGLTGMMQIRNESGNTSFSVEEYKRPRFEVTFQPVKGSFRLNDEVSVSGEAEAYAGANIDNAEVQFRVVRKARFPYFWDYRHWWPGFYTEEIEILNGITTTDENGEFSIEFSAIPDPRISKEHKPVFNYEVHADVTDISGETRSATTNVQVGYTALSVDLQLPENINKEEAQEVSITTENLNGEFEPAAGKISIHQLEAPDRIFRERLWAKPDTFVMSKAEFYRAFPHDVYDDEDDFRTREKEKRVFERRFDTAEDKTFTLKDMSGWAEGKYVAELTTEDKFGEEVKVVKYLSLYSLKDKAIPDKALLWSTTIKGKGEPGETAAYVWGSAADNIHAFLEVFHRNQIQESRWIRTGEEKNKLEFPIREKHRGNFGFSLFFVKFGRVHQIAETIQVPWSNKELKISFETFRDKLKPGQEEEWKIKISGPKGDQVAAEMAAAMYDASLDAFRPHNWQFSIYPRYSLPYYWRKVSGGSAFSSESFSASGKEWNQFVQMIQRQYDRLNWFGYSPGVSFYPRGGLVEFSKSAGTTALGEPEMAMDLSAEPRATQVTAMAAKADGEGEEEKKEEAVPPAETFEGVPVRANLQETAFFYPDLQTNEAGEIIFSFTMPEALTRWKFLGFAHTRALEYALTEKEVITQKELMVTPNAPRFFREGDQMTFAAKVSNLTEKELSGTAVLQLFDAISMEPVDEQFKNQKNTVEFTAAAGQSAPLRWDIAVPEGVEAVTYRVIAKTENFSDGEEDALPVLTNRMLVTETMPMSVRAEQRKTFEMEKLINAKQSKTLRHQKLTLEFTPNPAWYAIQALPYLMEFPYECSEQIFSRYYANSIASHIANSYPKIQRVFERWKDSDALLSNLEKNQELKSLLLEETPWVLEAQDEATRKKRVGLLFDLNKMSYELQNALRKLQQMQLNNGGWPWFEGMRDNPYITRHIVGGLGHLDNLGVRQFREDQQAWQMLRKAINYLDNRMKETYDRLIEREADMEKQQIGRSEIHYLYARSYFMDVALDDQYQKAFDYWKRQAGEYWLEFNRYMQGMTALSLHRLGETAIPQDIIKSLKEHALHSEEMGMYWKEPGNGYYWYQAPIETQALMIELFEEVADQPQTVDEMRVWLLKQKQTRDWKSTKATTEACYALLMRGTDWLVTDQKVDITVGAQKINLRTAEGMKVEAGTGYFKTSWNRSEINPAMGRVIINKQDQGVSWGALYWQYFEQLDKITPHETPLKLTKEVFLQKPSPTGPVLEQITTNSDLEPGDLLKVRIELRVDRPMEYVHMKDMRAAGLEPLNVLSRHKYQGGLSYYESTRDASANFFFDYLPKGTYVFEYPLRVTHAGNFSNGITTIQSMYAPEFASHSEGIRLTVRD